MLPVGRDEGVFHVEYYNGAEVSRLGFHGERFVYSFLHFLHHVQSAPSCT